jgi:hypothetical protein
VLPETDGAGKILPERFYGVDRMLTAHRSSTPRVR